METAASLLLFGLPLVLMGLGTAAVLTWVFGEQTLVPVPVRVRRQRR